MQMGIVNYDGDCIWLSSKPEVASISSDGVIAGLSLGEATIYGILSDNITLTLTIYVIGPDSILGDINKDGDVSVSDVVALYKFLHCLIEYTEEQWTISDINQDGSVDVFDLALLKKAVISQ